MNNPLKINSDWQPANPHPFGSQEWCDWRNARIARHDVEWALGSSGPYLRDRDEFTRRNTEAIEKRHERERADWLHRHRNPVDRAA